MTHNKGPIIRRGFANTSASRNTAGGHLRASFSELKESDIEDPLQRTWKQVCQLVLNDWIQRIEALIAIVLRSKTTEYKSMIIFQEKTYSILWIQSMIIFQEKTYSILWIQ